MHARCCTSGPTGAAAALVQQQQPLQHQSALAAQLCSLSAVGHLQRVPASIVHGGHAPAVGAKGPKTKNVHKPSSRTLTALCCSHQHRWRRVLRLQPLRVPRRQRHEVKPDKVKGTNWTEKKTVQRGVLPCRGARPAGPADPGSESCQCGLGCRPTSRLP